MEQDERALDAKQAWDCIVASWPEDIQAIDQRLAAVEDEIRDIQEVAVQQLLSRCRRYVQEQEYAFTAYHMNNGLMFFERAVEEFMVQEFAQVDSRADYREKLTEKFLQVLDEEMQAMRTEEQQQRMREDDFYTRFPTDILSMALITQALRLLARYLANAQSMSRTDYLTRYKGSLLELLNKHVTQLDMGNSTY